jgi:hypothetical protein
VPTQLGKTIQPGFRGFMPLRRLVYFSVHLIRPIVLSLAHQAQGIITLHRHIFGNTDKAFSQQSEARA